MRPRVETLGSAMSCCLHQGRSKTRSLALPRLGNCSRSWRISPTSIGAVAVAGARRIWQPGLRGRRRLGALFPAIKRSAADIEGLIAAHAGCIWVRDKDPDLIQEIGQALMEHEECGMVYSAPRNEVEGIVPGSFSRCLVMADHARSPDIYYILNTNDEPNEHGYIGTCHFESNLSVGGGIHGGMHAKELHSVCFASGSLFGDAKTIDTHSGIFDIAPTILQGLGIAAPQSMDGRVLGEAFADRSGDVVDPAPERHETGFGQYQQVLLRTRLGDACYLDGGWREG